MLLDALLQATPLNGQDATPQVPGAYVEERFLWLQQLVERPEGLPSQLDAVMSTLQEVYNELNRMAMSSGGALAAPGEGTALQRFQQEAGRLQGPMARWATQIGTGSSGITAAGTRARLNDIWTSQVLPFCELALTDRYPFNARAEAEISASDFAKLFAPGGLIDTFVTEKLLRLVDTTTTPWTWKTVNDAELGLSPAVLEQMQNAAEIRDAFFTAGAAPSVSFEMKPYSLDTRAQAVSLDIDGTEVAYQHGGQINPVRVTWPGAVGNSRITLQPPLPGIENTLVRDGPWAWFRLLSAAEVRRLAAPDQRRVIFSVGGRTATFDMRSGSALNPFGLPALSEFNCPKSL
jgi:type VI secretion system protein ImpL